MLKNTQETAVNTVEVTFIIAKDVFSKAVDNAYKKEVKKIQVPGFRKGKAPKAIIEKMYGKGVFYETALNAVVPEAADAAIAECGFKPVATPEISNVDFENEEGVEVKVTFTRRPDVKLGKYKNIKAVKTVISVDDAAVAEELAAMQKRNARTTEITDAPAILGDTALIDYEGFVGGVPFDGGKGENYNLKLGSGNFIPGFEDQIVGKTPCDEAFEITVKFPEEYHAEELKGKEAQFKVVLHKLEREELPELDDDFAKDASEFDTLDELKADIKARLEKRNADEADRRLSADLSDALAGIVKAEIPEVMVAKEVELLVREYDLNLRQNGLSLDMLIQYTGMTLESIKEQYKAIADTNVKKNLALEEIIKAEGIAATEEDVEKRYQEIADAYRMDVAEVKKSLPAENLEEEVCSIKAFDLVKGAADITERVITAEEFEKEQKAKEEAPEKKEAPAKEKKTTKAKTSEKTTTTKKTTSTTSKPRAKKAAPAEKKEDAE